MICIKYVKRNCLSTLEHEGIKPSAYAIKTNDLFLTGKITAAEARKKNNILSS